MKDYWTKELRIFITIKSFVKSFSLNLAFFEIITKNSDSVRIFDEMVEISGILGNENFIHEILFLFVKKYSLKV